MYTVHVGPPLPYSLSTGLLREVKEPTHISQRVGNLVLGVVVCRCS